MKKGSPERSEGVLLCTARRDNGIYNPSTPTLVILNLKMDAFFHCTSGQRDLTSPHSYSDNTKSQNGCFFCLGQFNQMSFLRLNTSPFDATAFFAKYPFIGISDCSFISLNFVHEKNKFSFHGTSIRTFINENLSNFRFLAGLFFLQDHLG